MGEWIFCLFLIGILVLGAIWIDCQTVREGAGPAWFGTRDCFSLRWHCIWAGLSYCDPLDWPGGACRRRFWLEW